MRRTDGMFISAVAAAIVVLACLLYLATATSGRGTSDWQLQVAGPVDCLSVGAGNVLYAFSGNNVTAISPDGQVRWSFDVADHLNRSIDSLYPIYSEGEGNVYLLTAGGEPYDLNVTPTDGDFPPFAYHLMAISSRGQLKWEYHLPARPRFWFDNPSVMTAGSRVYLYDRNQETVLDDRGNVLFNVTGILDQAAVDEDGHLYVVPMGNNTAYSWRFDDNYSGSTANLFPSRAIDAYGSDGTLLWHRELDDYVHMPYAVRVPQYRDGMVYTLAGDGVVVLDRSGNEIWSYDFGVDDIRLNEYMPADSAGNLYVDAGNDRSHWYPDTFAVNVTDRSVRPVKIPATYISYANLGHVRLLNQMANSVCYQVNTTDVVDVQPIAWSQFDLQPGVKDIEDIDIISITATDLTTGRQLWNFTIPADDARMTIINGSNVGLIFEPRALLDIGARRQNLSLIGDRMYVDHNSTPVDSWSSVQILPGNGVTYVNVNDVNFEPIVFNQSKCYYINGIYALNETGQLLWFRPADSRIGQAVVANGTIFYSTGGGKIFSGSNGVVSGVAILATLYVFLRFLMIGAVSRARSRLGSNENRNRVYRYIADSPGPTLYDISRDLGMNVGTARYHLMILGYNHRIVTCKAFGRYARYFTNSGSHGPDRQLLFSALRRQGIKNILGLLAERPGLSNREIAGELRMQESAASRYMKELMSIGLVEKRNKPEGRHAYYINEQYAEALVSAIKTGAGKML